MRPRVPGARGLARATTLASPAALALFLAACGRSRPAASVTLTDSAGVTIVTSSTVRSAAVARWRIDSVPSLEIASSANGPYTLFRVGDVVPLAGGRIAVADRGTWRVLVFGAGGQLVTAFGRHGDGPGEFGTVGSIAALRNDSVAVFDPASDRLSVFGPEGRFAHDAELEDTILQSHGALASIFGLHDRDLVLFTSGSVTVDPTPHPAPFRVESESMRIASDGTVLARYGAFPGQAQFSDVPHVGTGSVLLGDRTDVAVVGDDLVVGTETSPEVRMYAPDGDLTRIARWPDHDRAITQARLDSAFDLMLTRVPEPQRPRARVMLARIPHADDLPPYRSIVTSDDGDVWVGEYDLRLDVPGGGSPERHWLVFAPDGTLTATIATPGGFEPRFVRDTRVVGVYEDSLGVESIRAYSIRTS